MRRAEVRNNANKTLVILAVIALICAHVYLNRPSDDEVEKEIRAEEKKIPQQVQEIQETCTLQQYSTGTKGSQLYTIDNRGACKKSAEKLLDYLETGSESKSWAEKLLRKGVDKLLGLLPMGFLLLWCRFNHL